MPLFGVTVTEFHDQLRTLMDADQAAANSSPERSLAINKFIDWACTRRGRVIGTYLGDIIFEFYA